MGQAGGQEAKPRSRDWSTALGVSACVAFLAAAAAAAGSYFDESASVCGSLLNAGTGPDCPSYRSGREHLVRVTLVVGAALVVAAFVAPRRPLGRTGRPAVLSALPGLLAPGIEVGLIVLIRHAWGPVSEEYTGMPDVWVPIALVAAVLLCCVSASGAGLSLGSCLAAGAVAVPAVAAVQALAFALTVPDHGVTQPMRLPFVYPVGQEHPLALAVSAVIVAALLFAARVLQDRTGRRPPPAAGAVAFLATSSLVTFLLVVDASTDAFSMAPLGVWVWAPSTLSAALVTAAGFTLFLRRGA